MTKDLDVKRTGAPTQPKGDILKDMNTCIQNPRCLFQSNRVEEQSSEFNHFRPRFRVEERAQSSMPKDRRLKFWKTKLMNCRNSAKTDECRAATGHQPSAPCPVDQGYRSVPLVGRRF